MFQSNVSSFYESLKQSIQAIQTVQQRYKERYKALIIRQIKNADIDNELTEDAINGIIEDNPDKVSELMSKQIFGTASVQMQNAANDILEKCEGIKRLQTQVKELVAMIQDINQILQQ